MERFLDVARRLANPDRLAPGESDRLLEEGKAILLVRCTIHATEVAARQMALLLSHQLATTQDPDVKGWLREGEIAPLSSLPATGAPVAVSSAGYLLSYRAYTSRRRWTACSG